MIADIRRRLETQPFEPFSIRTQSRQCYGIASPEQAEILPCGTRVTVHFDGTSQGVFRDVHIVAVESGLPLAKAKKVDNGG